MQLPGIRTFQGMELSRSQPQPSEIGLVILPGNLFQLFFCKIAEKDFLVEPRLVTNRNHHQSAKLPWDKSSVERGCFEETVFRLLPAHRIGNGHFPSLQTASFLQTATLPLLKQFLFLGDCMQRGKVLHTFYSFS